MKRLDPEIEAKYEVLAAMGEGGMGAVYKVRHRHLDEVRVIKVVREKFRGDENLALRFQREAKTAVKLRHPNIAEIIDYDVTTSGTAYIVMEFIEGVNLRELAAQRGGVLDPVFVVECAKQTLSALAFLHKRGFIHRDISPDNIMVIARDDQPVVKLIDLGLAKSVEASRALTKDGHFVGKVHYASPEQFGAADVDARSDLYSLGVTMYELLTGEVPIPGSDYKAIIAGHLGRPPRQFAETDPAGRVPSSLRKAILKALEKDPADRFESADEFRAVLPSDLPPVAPPAPAARAVKHPSERTTIISRPPKRRRSPLWAVLAVIAIAAGWWLWTRQTSTVVPQPAARRTIAPARSPTVVATGDVLLKALPWAEVASIIDGAGNDHVSSRPLYTPAVVALPEGTYRVTFVHPSSPDAKAVAVNVKAGASVECSAQVDTIDALAFLRQAP